MIIKKHILKTLENGSSVHFKWSYSDTSILKETDYNNLYAAYYKNWTDTAIDLYNDINTVLKEVKNQRIVDHQRLMENVFMTKYENDISIIVNYNKNSVNINGLNIEAENYRMIRGDK